MAGMFRRSWSVPAFAAFAAASLAQSPAAPTAPTALQPIDMFRLDYLMVAGAEDPKDWIDAAHYLVFDAGPGALPGRGTPGWSVVEAATGARERAVDRRALGASLAAALGSADGLDEALADADAWTWNAAHTQFVVSVKQDLFVGARDGTVTRLTNTPDRAEEGVQFSPDGVFVAFVAHHDVFVVPAAGGPERALTQGGGPDTFFGRLDWVYQEEVFGRGNFQGFWWSPDSRYLAVLKLDESPVQDFVLVRESPARPEIEKTRYPKTGEPNPVAELAAIAVADGQTKWFDLAKYPAQDRLVVRVTWAPDSREVFCQVQNREQTWLDMLAGDPASGALRKVWREDSDCWVEPGPEPVFLQGGEQFLWLSERDGFRHLYRFDRGGKELPRLSQGEWQVQKIVGVDEANGVVYATADKASPLQSQLYAFPLAGGDPRQVTQGGGTHEVTMAPDFRSFVSRWSDVKTPPCTFLLDLQGAEVRAIAKSKTRMLKNYDLAEPHFVQVTTRDGFPMEAMYLKPKGAGDGKRFPVVQHTYSGPHTPLVRDRWGSRDFLWHQLLAQRGYAVFVCDNRSASGKGRKYAKACWRDLGRSELRDLEDGLAWLGEQDWADTTRAAIWGWSYGGYQTLYNLTHSTKWKCGVAVNPVTDWRNYDSIYTERYGGLPKDQQGYEAGSCVAAAGKLSGSLLLCCAAMDDNVHMQNSLQFLKAMQEAGKDCDFMVYPGVRHGIEDLQQQLHLFGRFERFLREKL